LRADLGERAQRWERIAFIPFGDGPDQLGFHSFGEGPASQPSSVAIGNDDTLWIADRWKFRLAHFTLRGTYLGDVPIDPGDRENRIRDVVRVGTTLYVSTYFQFGRIRAVGPDLRVRRLQVQDRGQALFVEEIFGTSSGAVVEVGGYTDALIAGHQDGPVGYFLLHPDGKLQRIQG